MEHLPEQMAALGEKLKSLRHQTGMTQSELAKKLRVSKATVSYYEQALRYPSTEVLIKIAQVFHVSADYLLGIEESKSLLDISDLREEDILLLEDAIVLLRKKNLGISNHRKKGRPVYPNRRSVRNFDESDNDAQ